jgi:protein-S-isoprenylcysteine O-methyltransferase Ste14
MNTGRAYGSVWIPPPLVVLVFILLGIGLQRMVPLPRWSSDGWRPVAVVLALAGLALGLSSVARFHAARTPVLHIHPSTAFVTGGPYRITRNPMYLGLVMIDTSLGLWLGHTWLLLLVPMLMAVLGHWVIGPEERYLESKFGEPYRAYRSRVRRWL